MQKIDLLPCPFCGKLDFCRMSGVKYKDDTTAYNVVCDATICGCGASCGWHTDTFDEAIKRWNTRASCLIPRSERMPDKDGYYLCVVNGEFKILPYGNGEFYSKCFDGVLRCCNSSVTRWMPLPSKDGLNET